MLVDKDDPSLSIDEQCKLLDLSRSSYYYEVTGESALNLEIMNQIDEIFTAHPFYGARKITDQLQRRGYCVNKKRISRLMAKMGLEAIYPKPNLSKCNPEHRIYPYLLRNLTIDRVNQVWSTDITYIRTQGGFVYLVAVIDWHSRYVLSWELSNSLDTNFCLTALEKALSEGIPEIFNTDQGAQFTSNDFTRIVKSYEIKISMDGRGRALDNIFVERLWRSVKYEDIYIRGYSNMIEVYRGLQAYFKFYNDERPHQSLGYRTPAEVHYENSLLKAS
jgi:putative transposase